MKQQTQWSKAELKTYILLLCAKADMVETKEEMEFIKSRTSPQLYDKLYTEFCKEDEGASLEKIQEALSKHEYSERELTQLKHEIQGVFSSDNRINMAERNLSRILDNILY